MLLIDAVFFIVELGVGLWVGSLALMADAFHMVSSWGKGQKCIDTNIYIVERYHLSRSRTLGCESCAKKYHGQIFFWSKSSHNIHQALPNG